MGLCCHSFGTAPPCFETASDYFGISFSPGTITQTSEHASNHPNDGDGKHTPTTKPSLLAGEGAGRPGAQESGGGTKAKPQVWASVCGGVGSAGGGRALVVGDLLDVYLGAFVLLLDVYLGTIFA